MTVSNIEFNRNQTGLGAPLPNNDNISGQVFYTVGTLPSGFGTNDRIKKITSVGDFTNLGVVTDQSDETKATGGQITVTGTWIIGEIVRVEIDGASIGQFTLAASTISSVVAGVVAAINAGTATGIKHGWVAVDNDPVIELAQPGKLGLLNDSGTPIVFVDRNATDTGASAGGTSTDVQMSSGVGSYHAVMLYHVSEFFRMQPKGTLWVGIYLQPTYDADEIRLIQDASGGQIRQHGIYISHEVFATSQVDVTQADLTQLETEDKPMHTVFHADMSATTMVALSSLATLSDERVTVVAGEDGNFHQPAWVNTKAYVAGEKASFQGRTYEAQRFIPVSSPGDNAGPFDGTKWTEISINLPAILGFSVSTVGLTLGTVALANVHESIGWVQKFDVVDGRALAEIGYATGELDSAVSLSLRDTLDNFHYVFLLKYQGNSGTFHNKDYTSVADTSDFARSRNVRTMDKAVRNVRILELPNIQSPLTVNPDGTLFSDTIAIFEDAADRALIAMLNAGEISAKAVDIDPTQNVLTTNTVTIAITLVPKGSAEDIVIPIGFAVEIA